MEIEIVRNYETELMEQKQDDLKSLLKRCVNTRIVTEEIAFAIWKEATLHGL